MVALHGNIVAIKLNVINDQWIKNGTWMKKIEYETRNESTLCRIHSRFIWISWKQACFWVEMEIIKVIFDYLFAQSIKVLMD